MNVSNSNGTYSKGATTTKTETVSVRKLPSTSWQIALGHVQNAVTNLLSWLFRW